ncbi:MAG: hypothetical protein FMNOHCHN_03600 [Ignavibacteriaceae bacterium]|nr:hypothetical protein [Ignavibacteriaceae bacterium]
MVKLSLFEYKDYKRYISDWIEHSPQKGRGLRKQLAEAIQCQTAFVTHVLSGNYHFSLEQAEACGRWMGLSQEEIEFLLLLVMHQRAGTKSLEKLLGQQIAAKKEELNTLKNRLKISEAMSQEDQIVYYSSWHFAAIHMALLIPELQTLEGLQNYFQLSPTRLRHILDFLVNKGLIKQEKGVFKSVIPVLHLGSNSPLLNQHHTNWRLKAIESIIGKSSSDLHYSGVISLSQDDFDWVRERLSQLLEEVVARLKDSKDEKLACLSFDWFQI